jgi:hypothetical protein
MTLLTGSLLLFATLGQSSAFWNILPGLLVGGLGMAIMMVPATSAPMGAVPVDEPGVGSAVINRMRLVGGSLGIAIMGTLVAASMRVGPATQGPEIGSTFHRDGAARRLPRQAGSSRAPCSRCGGCADAPRCLCASPALAGPRPAGLGDLPSGDRHPAERAFAVPQQVVALS